MFLLSNFIAAVARILDMVLSLYIWIFIIRALISWVNPDPYNPIVQILNRLTEPVLYRIRRLIPMSGTGIDFTPMIAILIIIFLQAFFIQSLLELARRLH